MTVADHLTLSELEQRVKKAGDPVEKARFLAVYHAKRGLTAKEIGKITLHSTRSFSRWCGATTKKALRP